MQSCLKVAALVKRQGIGAVLNNSLSAHDSIDLIYSNHVTHSTKLA